MIKQLKLISKFMTAQTGQQIITIYILPNISRSKGNQTINWVREYNMRNIFLEKSYGKCGGEVSLRPFYKKIRIEHISGSTV